MVCFIFILFQPFFPGYSCTLVSYFPTCIFEIHLWLYTSSLTGILWQNGILFCCLQFVIIKVSGSKKHKDVVPQTYSSTKPTSANSSDDSISEVRFCLTWVKHVSSNFGGSIRCFFCHLLWGFWKRDWPRLCDRQWSIRKFHTMFLQDWGQWGNVILYASVNYKPSYHQLRKQSWGTKGEYNISIEFLSCSKGSIATPTNNTLYNTLYFSV